MVLIAEATVGSPRGASGAWQHTPLIVKSSWKPGVVSGNAELGWSRAGASDSIAAHLRKTDGTAALAMRSRRFDWLRTLRQTMILIAVHFLAASAQHQRLPGHPRPSVVVYKIC